MWRAKRERIEGVERSSSLINMMIMMTKARP